MNKVNLIGRVGGDVELRHTPSGKPVAMLTLAVDDGFGEGKKTAWIAVTLWGPTAECAHKYVRKGDRLGISGRLSQEEWEDKDTKKKQRKTKVTCEDMHLITDKRSDDQPSSGVHAGRPSHQNGAEPPASTPDTEDDDVPF